MRDVAKHRLVSKRWKLEHPERIRELKRNYARSNRQKESARRKLWRHKNSERLRVDSREKLRKCRAENPEQWSVYKARRRAREFGAKGSCTVEQWKSRIAYYGWRCAYCRKELIPRTTSQDHRIPLSRGGTNWPSNLLPACKSCNSRKHDRTEREFRKAINR